MKIRLLLAVICLVVLPMWFSPDKGDNTNSAPFASVAIAGHTTGGNFCECGRSGCICDPNEEDTGHAVPPVKDTSPRKDNLKPKPGRVSELDLSTTAIMIGLALLLWSRLRN